MTSGAALRGELRHDEAMARHVTWCAGGLARHAYFPADLQDLASFLRALRADEPVLFVGLGSNLLVRDGGFDGTVVFTHGALKQLTLNEDRTIYAEAGVASPKLARFAALHGFGGGEFLAGIPGTVGGALVMNAGCYGGETWNVVERVHTIDRGGNLRVRRPDEYAIGYRHCGARAAVDEWFVGAWFQFPAGDAESARARMRELLRRRVETQPLQQPNAGSVFRNPPGDHAARLIESAGLKGRSLGGARVSDKHANFIVNPARQASASDIEALIDVVQREVAARHGTELRREVRIVGARTGGKV